MATGRSDIDQQRSTPMCVLERAWPLAEGGQMETRRGDLIGVLVGGLVRGVPSVSSGGVSQSSAWKRQFDGSSGEHKRIRIQIPQHITCCGGGIATTIELRKVV